MRKVNKLRLEGDRVGTKNCRIQIFSLFSMRGLPILSAIFLPLLHLMKFCNWGNPLPETGESQNIIWMSKITKQKHMLTGVLIFIRQQSSIMMQGLRWHIWARTRTNKWRELFTSTKTKMYLSPSLNFSMSRSRTFPRTSCKKLKTSLQDTLR